MAFLGSVTLTVTRYAPGMFVDGDWVNGVESTFTARGTLRPLSEKDKQLLPVGTRATDIRKFYTRSVLQLAIEEDGIKSDRLTDGVDVWELTAIADNEKHIKGVPHYRYELTRVGKDEP